ncbi:hypothetical protein GCM10011317_49990 [Niveispirillum cyanobacteriorum]|nr:hypothetical protein GCM10011317_49990 [Niveispirillum cyanobacteriorum]
MLITTQQGRHHRHDSLLNDHATSAIPDGVPDHFHTLDRFSDQHLYIVLVRKPVNLACRMSYIFRQDRNIGGKFIEARNWIAYFLKYLPVVRLISACEKATAQQSDPNPGMQMR